MIMSHPEGQRGLSLKAVRRGGLVKMALAMTTLASFTSAFHFTSDPRAALTPMFSTATPGTSSPVPRAQSPASLEQTKRQIFQLAAMTDRGKLQDPLVSEEGLYRPEKARMIELLESLAAKVPVTMDRVQNGGMDGEWELLWSSAQLFRSSPFFLAIEAAYNDSAKAELFFKLHELQTGSWGVSQVGRVAQVINSGEGTLESYFDTVLLPLTTIPLLGFWKLLPTFGGRIITVATELKAREGLEGEVWLDMVLDRTRFKRVEGLGVMPGFGSLLEDREFPTRSVWTLLPWNGGRPPRCSLRVLYVDDDVRVMQDVAGATMVYARTLR